MSIFDLSEDEVRKLYTDASEHYAARQLRDHMVQMIDHELRDIVREQRDLWAGHRSDFFRARAGELLEKLQRICNEQGWERIGRPIMAKIEAEHQMQIAMNYLTTQEMLKPPVCFMASDDPKP